MFIDADAVVLGDLQVAAASYSRPLHSPQPRFVSSQSPSSTSPHFPATRPLCAVVDVWLRVFFNTGFMVLRPNATGNIARQPCTSHIHPAHSLLDLAVVPRTSCRRPSSSLRRSGAERPQRVLPRPLAAAALHVQFSEAPWHLTQPPAVVSHFPVSRHVPHVTSLACTLNHTLPTSVLCTFWESSRGLARACATATPTTQTTRTRSKCERSSSRAIFFVSDARFRHAIWWREFDGMCAAGHVACQEQRGSFAVK